MSTKYIFYKSDRRPTISELLARAEEERPLPHRSGSGKTKYLASGPILPDNGALIDPMREDDKKKVSFEIRKTVFHKLLLSNFYPKVFFEFTTKNK